MLHLKIRKIKSLTEKTTFFWGDVLREMRADLDDSQRSESELLAKVKGLKGRIRHLKKLEDAKAEIEEKIKNINVKEDVDALVDGEDLSEEFKEKAATIFEAAVKSKIRSEVERDMKLMGITNLGQLSRSNLRWRHPSLG